MSDSTRDNDRILREAQRSLLTQQDGGTHRPGLSGPSIGKASANAKLQTWIKRAGFFGAALIAILTAMTVTGWIIGGIGFWGLVITFFAVLAAFGVFSRFPRVKNYTRTEIKKGNPRQMVERAEIWLEAQRPALPPPAAVVVDQLGVQLDALGLQLQTLDEAHPAMDEVRELVGEYIPETIDNYRKIPANMRSEEHAGKSADDRLTESLTKLSGEVDRVTRRLAEGALDDLAVKSRYLEYRYGGDELLDQLSGSTSSSTTPLPDLSPDLSSDTEKAK